MAQQFLEKAIAHHTAGEVEAAILLLNRTGAQWYRKLKAKVSAVCEVNRRINFIDANGIPQRSPRYYNDFLYLGKEPQKFLEVFGAIGITNVV